MPEASDKRERHGMGNVGTHEPLGRQQRIERRQHRDADRAGAHRGQRDEKTQDDAEQDRRKRAGRHVALVVARRCPRDERIEHDEAA
jgi:hypothetical protein